MRSSLNWNSVSAVLRTDTAPDGDSITILRSRTEGCAIVTSTSMYSMNST